MEAVLSNIGFAGVVEIMRVIVMIEVVLEI